MNKPDSIIFDMDGTLWDALDIYVEAWNRGLAESGLNKNVSRNEIAAMVGWEKQQVLKTILPECDCGVQEKVYQVVNRLSPSLIKEIGGTVYEGVVEGLAQLSGKYRLFIVSNCANGIIELFMERSGIGRYITDSIAHGANLMPKHHNMRLLAARHNLEHPVYVGDTEGDSEQSAIAGIPFIFLSSGFGKTEKYALKFDSFKNFAAYFSAWE